jgi:cobalt-zinc-cadmium efflux system protein
VLAASARFADNGRMSHSHAGSHDHQSLHSVGADHSVRRPLVIALVITTAFLVVEVIGGVVTGSLALLADAGHMATDVAALGLSLFAMWLARRPATPERSFGFRRAEILAALLNSATLVVISLYIFWESFQRLGDPPDVDSGPMLAVALAGLLANALSAWVLMRGGGHQENLNVRGAFLHVVGDMLGSVGAIAAALIMLATGWYLADPLLSAGIGLLILWSSWNLLRESADVLLEATPRDIDARAVQADLLQSPGVAGIHDLHIWTVTSGLVAVSGHVEVTGDRDWSVLLQDLSTLLRDRYGIGHVTLQPEPAVEGGPADALCSFDTPEGRAACLTLLHRHD